MAIIRKALIKFYLTKAEAATANETPGDIGYFSDGAPAGWFEASIDNGNPAVDGNTLQGSESNLYWKRIVNAETEAPTPVLVPDAYAEGTAYQQYQIVESGGKLYVCDSAHTPTAAEVTSLAKVTELGTGAAGIADVVAVEYKATETYKAFELVYIGTDIFVTSSAHTADADNVTNKDQLIQLNGGGGSLDEVVAKEYVAATLYKAYELVRIGSEIFISGSEHTPTAGEVADKSKLIPISEDKDTGPGVHTSVANETDYRKGDVFKLANGIFMLKVDFTTDANATDAEVIAQCEKLAGPEASVRTSFTNSTDYFKGDFFIFDSGTYRVKADFQTDANATEAEIIAACDKLSGPTQKTYAGFPASTAFSIGDIVTEDDRSYVVKTAFSTGASDNTVTDQETNLLPLFAEHLVPRVYSNGAVLKENEIFEYGGNLYFTPNSVDGTSTNQTTWAEIESSCILVAQVPVTATPDFVAANTYNANDVVKFDGLEWKLTGTHTVNDPIDLTNWSRVITTGVNRGEHKTNHVYLKDDIVTRSGIAYKANANVDDTVSFAEGLSGATFIRLDTAVFDGLSNSKVYIVGDIVSAGTASYAVHTAYKSAAAATEAELAANSTLIATSIETYLPTYTNGSALKNGQLFFYDEAVYRADADKDGTTASETTWAEIEGEMTFLFSFKVEPAPAAWAKANAYAVGDKATYAGQVVVATAASAANDEFSYSDWTRELDYPYNQGDHVNGRAYMKGDVVFIDSVEYIARSNVDSDAGASEIKLGVSSDFYRLTPTTHSDLVADTLYSNFDIVIKEGITYLVTTPILTTSSTTWNDLVANMTVVADNSAYAVREYVAEEDLKKYEFVVEPATGDVYVTTSAIAGNAGNTFQIVKDNGVRVAESPVTPVPDFDAGELYTENDEVRFESMVYTAKDQTGRLVNDAFSLTYFERNIPAGFKFGDFVANKLYLNGDFVTNGGIEYKVKATGTFATLTETNTTFERTSTIFKFTLEAAKRYIPGDLLYLTSGAYYVRNEFTTNNPADIDDHAADIYVIAEKDHPPVEEYVPTQDGEEFKLIVHNEGLYFIKTAWTADVSNADSANWTNDTFDKIKGNLVELVPQKNPTPIAFVQADTYQEDDYVSHDGFNWHRNDSTTRKGGDAFSLDHFNREEAGGQNRGTFTSGQHYLSGDKVFDNGIEYRANTLINYGDVTVFVEGLGLQEFVRITPIVHQGFAPDTLYIRGDWVIEDGVTYYVQPVTFFESGAAETLAEFEARNEVEVIADHRILNPREYVAKDNAEQGEIIQYQGSVYYVTTAWVSDTTDADAANHVNHEWDAVKDKVVALYQTPAPVLPVFDAATAYNANDEVQDKYGLVWTRRNVADGTAQPLTETHWTRNDADPQIFEHIPDREYTYLPNDKIKYGTSYFHFNLANDLASADIDEWATWLEANTRIEPTGEIKIVAGNGSLTGLEYVAPGQLVSFLTDGTLNGLQGKQGETYVITSTMRSTTLNKAYFVKIAEKAKLATAFDATATYATGDLVTIAEDSFTYELTGTHNVNDAFNLTNWSRVEPAQHRGAHSDAVYYITGDKVTNAGKEYEALGPISKTAFAEGIAGNTFKRVTQNVAASLTADMFYVEGDIFNLNGYDLEVTAAFQADADPTFAENIANMQAINVDEKYYLAAADGVAFHDYNKKEHVFIFTEDRSTELFNGFTPMTGDRMVLKRDRTATNNPPIAADFDIFLAKQIEDAIEPHDDGTAYLTGDKVTYQGFVWTSTEAQSALVWDFTKWTRDLPGGEHRGTFSNAVHYRTGDTVTHPDDGALYAINSNVDSVAAFNIGSLAAEWTRVGPGIFTDASVVAWNTQFFKGDRLYFGKQYRTVTEDFAIGADPADGSVPELDETKLRIEGRWDRSNVRTVTADESVSAEEVVRYGNKLYFVFADYVPSDPVVAAELEAKIYELVNFESTQHEAYDAAKIYAEGDIVSYQDEIFQRTNDTIGDAGNFTAARWTKLSEKSVRTAGVLADMNDWYVGVDDIVHYQGITLTAKVARGVDELKIPFDDTKFDRAGNFVFNTAFSYLGRRALIKGDFIIDGRNMYFVTAAFEVLDGESWDNALRTHQSSFRLVGDYELLDWQADTFYRTGDLVKVQGYEMVVVANHTSASAWNTGELLKFVLRDQPTYGFTMEATDFIPAGTKFDTNGDDDSSTALPFTITGTVPLANINLLLQVGFRFFVNKTDITDAIVVDGSDATLFDMGSIFLEAGDVLEIAGYQNGEGTSIAEVVQGGYADLTVTPTTANVSLTDANKGQVIDITAAITVTAAGGTTGSTWTVVNRSGGQLAVTLGTGITAIGNVNVQDGTAITLVMLDATTVLIAGGVA
ncbi:tail fiber protein [Vibrio phage vB_VpaM_sm033]|nr:tail fiber protein [Vibrio phage vB_VpaM_sm033]